MNCWKSWKHRPSFTSVRNQWSSITAEEQRALWVASRDFSDEGEHFRNQMKSSALQSWRLGIETSGQNDFAQLFMDWARSA